MALDKVNTTDTVQIGIFRDPPPQPKILCPNCNEECKEYSDGACVCNICSTTITSGE